MNKLKKQFLLSTLVLILSFGKIFALYQFGGKKILLTDDLKIMSYNVRKLNADNNLKITNIPDSIKNLVHRVNPDILILQEFLNHKKIFPQYPHKYLNPWIKGKTRNAVYSKYEIVNKDIIEFNNSSNGSIFVDLVVNLDTIRIYNIHLESLRIRVDQENFGEKDSDKLIQRFSNTFKKQATQVEQILEHQKNCTYI